MGLLRFFIELLLLLFHTVTLFHFLIIFPTTTTEGFLRITTRQQQPRAAIITAPPPPPTTTTSELFRLMMASENCKNNQGNDGDYEVSEVVSAAAAAPLYITIGPQCCGKTTWLKTTSTKQKQQQQKSADASSLFLENEILDVCLDDQQDVYASVPTDDCLFWWNKKVIVALEHQQQKQDLDFSEAEVPSPPVSLQRTVQNRSLVERLQNDNMELMLVLQRWKKQISSQEFQQGMTKHLLAAAASTYRNNNNSNNSTTDNEATAALIKDWIATVELFLESQLSPPKQIMLFCLESIFQPHPKTNQTAIEMATQTLQNTPSTIPVAWGNTNSKSRDYIIALEYATEQNRPVYFIKERQQKEQDQENGEATTPVATFGIPRVPLTTLWYRNLHRFSQTGKYIPAMTIEMTRNRVDELLQQAYGCFDDDDAAGSATTYSTSVVSDNNNKDLALDQKLTSLAGTREYYFQMNNNRQITKVQRKNQYYFQKGRIGPTTSTKRNYENLNNNSNKSNNNRRQQPQRFDGSQQQQQQQGRGRGGRGRGRGRVSDRGGGGGGRGRGRGRGYARGRGRGPGRGGNSNNQELLSKDGW